MEQREGPSPIYVAWKPGTSQVFQDRKPLLKFAQWPASTPTGRRLRDWLDEIAKAPSQPSEGHTERIKAEGFGPEAHESDDTLINVLFEGEPNDNTKTVI